MKSCVTYQMKSTSPPPPNRGGSLTGRTAVLLLASALYIALAATSWAMIRSSNEEADRELLVQLLAPMGFEIRTAASGHDCLDLMAAGYAPDAILMDLAMPGIDGWETINPKGVASRVYPRGTRLRLTRTLTTDVVVNDYGPKAYTGNDLDVSRQVASKLEFVKSGLATVDVEVIR